jgi:hypothetical protein
MGFAMSGSTLRRPTSPNGARGIFPGRSRDKASAALAIQNGLVISRYTQDREPSRHPVIKGELL